MERNLLLKRLDEKAEEISLDKEKSQKKIINNPIEHLFFLEKEGKAKPSVLIIEDDIESVLFIEKILEKQDVEINHAFSYDDAVLRLKSNRYDIVILDWFLENKTGGDVISEVIEKINSGEASQNKSNKKSKIVTYSGVDAGKISLPENNSFEHYEHWMKPMKLPEFRSKTLKLFHSMGL